MVFWKKKIVNKVPQSIIDEAIDEIINRFVAGILAANFETNVILKKNETLIFAIPNIILAEERSIKTKGGYLGFSIRIMKGISIRPGTFQAERETKVTQIDQGLLTLTNKRIVFDGERNSRNIILSSINSISPTDNGFGINRTGKSKTEFYIGIKNVKIGIPIEPDENDNFDSTTINWELDGYAVKEIIQRLINL
ncbi:MAG: hypothetical protein K9N05_02685 [Candidatus Marinimicrobia bacterium]|nr:hypothetical protein [Candidatus Neomarinimicrobiota bacterium]